MTRLGMMYHNALGIGRDPAVAATWWAKAAARGDADGQAMLGAAHLLGAGVPRDGVAALAWLLRATAGGSALAAPFLNNATQRTIFGRNCRSRTSRRGAIAGAGVMIIGTAGHVDHGKTALVRALTGIDTDRLKEEKARGISIDLGFAYLPAPNGAVLGFVDVPGHEKFVHNMLAGAGGIDFALLVVAADDGVMPQTREHLAIVDLLSISRGLVALTKIDLVADDRREAVRAEIARALEATSLTGSDIVPVSAVSGEGIEALRDRLFAQAQATEHTPAQGRFRLAVDRSFTLTGVGTVVTGTVLSGTIAVGDQVTVSPSGLSARARSIHAQNRAAERGQAGERCALNLAGEGIAKDLFHRGDVVLDPALHAPTDRIDAHLRLLASERKPIAQWTPVRLHHAAAEVGTRVVLLGDEPITPGDQGVVQLVLERPIAAAVGDRFVLRNTSAQRTIGGGVLLDLRGPVRKRRTPERTVQLGAHAIRDPERAMAALLQYPPGFCRSGALCTRPRPRHQRSRTALRMPRADAHSGPARSDCVIARSLAAAQKQHARPARNLPS
jgi:selenocysteine-specific elongation factor